MSVNKFIGLGRLSQSPELKYTQSGTAVCNFSLALNETYKDKNGQKQEKVEFVRIVVWGKLAELCNQYLSKGRQAYIEGKLETRSWDDKDTGKKMYRTEINATTVQFLGGQASEGQGQESKPSQDYSVAADAQFAAEDIPFSPRHMWE